MSRLTRWAKRLSHPYSAWVVMRAVTLGLALLKVMWLGANLGRLVGVAAAALWVGGLALYPLYRARGRDSLPDDPLDPFWCRPVRPTLWQRRWLYLERRRLLPVLEVGGSSLLLLATGGVSSPFHEFAQTSLVAPAMQYGLRGAGLATLYFVLLYGCLVGQRPDPLQMVLLCSPIQTALVAALLGLLLTQLRQRNLLAEEVSRNQERHRLIQELHDGSAQTQYALSLKLENLAEKAAMGGLVEGAAWDRLIYLSRKALLETRQAMVDPDLVLNRATTLEALFSPLTRDFQSVSDIQVHCRFDLQPRLTPSQRVHLYRFAQEALANVFKYSNATRCWLSFSQSERGYRLEIRDDGRGYDQAEVKSGRGLSSMQRRADDLGGALIRWAEPGKGSLTALEWKDDYSPHRR
ncbi:hypothetical protein IV102_26870 [bacterium]|nr:hypothetical protein [bacterium]